MNRLPKIGSVTFEQVSALTDALNMSGVNAVDAVLGRDGRISLLKIWVKHPEVFATNQARLMAEETAKFFVE